MHSSTVFVLACLVAVAVAAQFEHYPEPQGEAQYESVQEVAAHDSSPRTKRGLLLLKKKLLLGALGLKAAKVGAVGVVGALALKSKAGAPHHAPVHHHHIEQHHPHSFVEVHDWSG